MPTIPPRLHLAESLVLVVDIQDRLLAKMPTAENLIRNTGFVLDVARLLDVPLFATEQYPKGLGPTTAAIAERLPKSIPAKTSFSCCGAEGFVDQLRASGRRSVVVVGMETHVCVLQTVLDLLEAGFSVFVPVDGVAGRHALDSETALRRFERSGAILTTVETIAFEWLGDAKHPQFKAVSRLVIARDTATGP